MNCGPQECNAIVLGVSDVREIAANLPFNRTLHVVLTGLSVYISGLLANDTDAVQLRVFVRSRISFVGVSSQAICFLLVITNLGRF